MTEKNKLELSVSRYIDAPPATVYRVWTERTEEWFAPKPFLTRVIEQDLRPGGRSAIEMEGPDGQKFPHEGVFLEVVPGRRIVSTNVFGADWQPRSLMTTECDFGSVTIFSFEPQGDGTLYTGLTRHFDKQALKKHEAMGFEEGWSMVAAQLAELAEAEARTAVAA
jgi:uncharacterized protein YndB with AHSA1/START domain